MHAMCSRLLLPAFGTCYTRTSCFLCRNIEEKKKGTNFFLVSCQFVENETCKLTNQTVASGGLSPATDQIKIWSRNLGGYMLVQESFLTFPWQKKNSAVSTEMSLSRSTFWVLEASYDAWGSVWHLCPLWVWSGTFCVCNKTCTLQLYLQPELYNYYITKENSPSSQCKHQDLRSLALVMQMSAWLWVCQKQEEWSL